MVKLLPPVYVSNSNFELKSRALFITILFIVSTTPKPILPIILTFSLYVIISSVDNFQSINDVYFSCNSNSFLLFTIKLLSFLLRYKAPLIFTIGGKTYKVR